MQNSRSTQEAGADHSIAPFGSLPDLASARVGGRALAASDDFFGPKSNLVRPGPPVFLPGKFTRRGKWMDGWESRRRRTPGHDWCIVKLGMRGRVRGVDVDTSYFTGNYPTHCSLDAIDAGRAAGNQRVSTGSWVEILPRSPLQGDTHNFFSIEDQRPWTHVRLNVYPDGGVARLRVHGDVLVDWDRVRRGGRLTDLAEIRNGGLVIAASDMHFGVRDNIIMPGRAVNMGDGWETRRRRGPGHDWAIVRLGTPGVIARVEVDTSYFKGNYPDRTSIDACLAPDARPGDLESADWREILPTTKLRPDRRHIFASALRTAGPASHVRLNIYPDGGISRFRVYGTPAPR